MSASAPWFVLVAGINGAGKSTFAQNYTTLRVLEAQGPEIEVINPDLITREILRFEPRLPLERANVRAAPWALVSLLPTWRPRHRKR